MARKAMKKMVMEKPLRKQQRTDDLSNIAADEFSAQSRIIVDIGAQLCSKKGTFYVQNGMTSEMWHVSPEEPSQNMQCKKNGRNISMRSKT